MRDSNTKHKWQANTSTWKASDPYLYVKNKFWACNVQARVNDSNTPTHSMKQNSPPAAGKDILYQNQTLTTTVPY
jgi:hypothetical protein